MNVISSEMVSYVKSGIDYSVLKVPICSDAELNWLAQMEHWMKVGVPTVSRAALFDSLVDVNVLPKDVAFGFETNLITAPIELAGIIASPHGSVYRGLLPFNTNADRLQEDQLEVKRMEIMGLRNYVEHYMSTYDNFMAELGCRETVMPDIKSRFGIACEYLHSSLTDLVLRGGISSNVRMAEIVLDELKDLTLNDI